jgi:hypothetical protein
MTRISRSLIARLVLAGLVAAASGLLAATPAIADATSCSPPALTQPFLSWGDTHYYTLTPGQTPGNFTATGWTLRGGARIIATRLADGTVGHVLDLPSGAKAISPQACVNSSYPTARTMIRGVRGAADLSFNVSYPGQPGFKHAGQLHAHTSRWTPSERFALRTESLNGWQLGRFEFIETAKHADAQLYNFYLDPYTRDISLANTTF